MDTQSHTGQVHPLQGRTPEEGSPEEEHHGKPSVMKRVRARARKFKDSITGHGHHHEPDNANDEEEEDDDEEEAQEHVQDPGAPMYESAAAKPFATSEDLNVDKPKVKLGEALHSHGDPHVPHHVDEFPRETKDPPHLHEPHAPNDPIQSFPPHLHDADAPRDPIQTFPPTNYQTKVSDHTPESYQTKETDIPQAGGRVSAGAGDPLRLPEDPSAPKDHVPPANYQTKVTDPTHIGGEEARIDAFRADRSAKYQTEVTDPTRLGGEGAGTDVFQAARPAKYQTEVTDPMDIGGEGAGTDVFQAARPAKYQTEVTDPMDIGGEGAGTDVFQAARPAKYQTEVTDHMDIGGEEAGIGGGGEEAGIAALRARPAKYQAEETKPANLCGEEPAIAPMISSFGKMEVGDEPENSDKFPATGTHDQFSPDSPSTKTQTNPPITQSVTEYPSHPPMNGDRQPTQQSSYTDKICFATSAVTDKAIQAKNAVASNLGYGGNDVRNAVASNLGYGGNDVTPGVETHREEQAPKGTTSVILEKASAAKDAFASKVGYGGNAGWPTSETHREGEPASRYGGNDGKVAGAMGLAGTEKMTDEQGYTGAGTGKGTGVVDYGRQMSATVTEKLAPVYGRVAGAGSAIASKIPGMGTQTGTGTGSPTGTPKGAGTGSNIQGYLSEKLKPGEDDKALSEVISGAFHKTKKEEVGVEEKPLGKVTESAEVAKRLGTESDETAAAEVTKSLGTEGDETATSGENPGQSYVGMLKGAVTSWFGKGGEMNPSQAFVDHSQGTGEKQGSVAADTLEHQGSVGTGREERKIQESTN